MVQSSGLVSIPIVIFVADPAHFSGSGSVSKVGLGTVGPGSETLASGGFGSETPQPTRIIITSTNLHKYELQCCGSETIYSGSGSSFEFSEFRIQAKVPDPCGSGSNLY